MDEMEPKLIVDTNVGHLARRLRMLGYDTLFINPIHDDRLFEVALKESRVIVSGDRGLFERRLIKSGRVKGFWVDVYEDHTDQLRRIIRSVGPSGALPFTRCIECNTPLLSKTREEAKEKVPPHVYETVAEYAYCPRCDQFFWEGDHVKRMREVIEKL